MNATTTKPKKNGATPPDAAFGFRLPIGPSFRVNAKRGSLDAVAILTGGREAAGHGIYLDQRTVETAADAVAAVGGRMRGAITHGSLLSFLKNGGDRILEVPGFFAEVRAEGLQLLGDFEFYESFRAEQPQAYARLMEMAAKTPDLMGLSAEPSGYLVYVAEDGTEYTATYDRETRKVSGAPDGVALKYEGMPVMRITRLRVAAFVDEPAANDNLFAKLSRLFGAEHRRPLDELRALAQSFLAWSADHAALTAPASNEGASPPDPAPHATQLEMSLLASLKAAFGSDKKKHTRALELASEDPTQTVDQIAAQLAAEAPPPPAADADTATLAAIKARFGADKARLQRAFAVLAEHETFSVEQIAAQLASEDAAELVRLRAENATLKGERDAATQKFEAIKASGHPQPLNLGAPSAGSLEASGEKKELTGRARAAAAWNAQLAAARN